MATRPRLKSRRGCWTCKRRKKKCDEVQPTCSACERLDLKCEWTSSQSEEDRDSKLLPAVQTISTAFQQAQQQLSLDSDFARKFDLHVIVMSLKTSWSKVKETFALEPQWLYLAVMDAQMCKVANLSLTQRLVNIWTSRILAKV